MGGARRGAGHPRKSLEDHLAEGTYRATRHRTWGAENVVSMPMPAEPPPDTTAALEGLGDAGRAWLTEHLQARSNWSSRDMALLRQAAEARDRQAAAQAVMATEGAFVKIRKRSVPHPALAIERQCSTAILTALRALTPVSAKSGSGVAGDAPKPANPLDKFLNRRQR